MDQRLDIVGRQGGSVSRRGLLAGAAIGGLAGMLGQATAATAAGATSTGAGAAPRANALSFFSDSTLNFQVLFALSAADYGASELGEVLTAIDRVHHRGDTYKAYYDAFLALGRGIRRRGDAASRAGRRITARNSYLRAAMYLDQALFFSLASGTPTRALEGKVYKEMEGCFAAAAGRFDPAFMKVAIPYERRTLPGWLLTPPGPRIRRPTVILNNGSDAQNIDLFVYGGAAALERGWNALIYEGPGQGSNLFVHNIPFRPDWEKVVTPVVSWLRGRSEVDRRRITLIGTSFGGYLVPRAAAFEHRLAGVVADPGVHDAFVSWSGPQGLPPNMLTWLREGKEKQFNDFWNQEAFPSLSTDAKFNIRKRSEIYGNGSFYARIKNASRFVLSRSVAQRISTPIAATAPDQEAFFPGQAKVLDAWLRAHPHNLIPFRTAAGAQFHCEPMAPTLRNDTVFDWLESNMRPVG